MSKILIDKSLLLLLRSCVEHKIHSDKGFYGNHYDNHHLSDTNNFIMDKVDETLKQNEYIAPNPVKWLTLEEFEKNQKGGFYWIRYKGKIEFAYYVEDYKAFVHNNVSYERYLTECITHVKRINEPDLRGGK